MQDGFAKQIQKFNTGSGDPAVVFEIGRALRHIASLESVLDASRFAKAKQALSFFKSQSVAARKAVDA